jgi:hypothetical protein
MKKLCLNCDHLNAGELSKCEKCDYFLFTPTESIEAFAPRKQTDAPSGAKTDLKDQEYLNMAFQQILLLFERAQREHFKMTDQERANVYESLLTSFLKMEREKIRRDVILWEKNNIKVTHQRLLLSLWGIGMLSGILIMTVVFLILNG